MRIDTHHHLWDMSSLGRDWLTGDGLDPIKRNFNMDEFLIESADSKIDLSILVQSATSYDELQEMFEVVQEHQSIAGIVAWIDMSSDDCINRLNSHLDHPGAEKLVGIRDGAQGRTNTSWLGSEAVVSNVKKLAKLGFTFDLLVDPPHLAASISLVQQVPNNIFILDHIGKPNIAKKEISEWSTAIKELAKSENVFCKISGMVTEANWKNWENKDFKPYFDVVLENFGVDRIMFGSDWPVCKLAATYEQVVQLAEFLVSELSENEKDYFWCKSAQKAYAI